MTWLLPLGLCACVCITIIRRLYAIHALDHRVPLQSQRLNLSRSFHRPLYVASLLLVILRSAFFLLSAVYEADERDSAVKITTFWLLDTPSVVLAGLSSYFVLFAVSLVFRRRWSGAAQSSNARDSNGLLTAVFVAFCASLMILVTLMAVCRAERDRWGFMVPLWMTFGYSAVIWVTLGVLLLKYGGQAVQILWIHRRRYRWEVSEEEESMRFRLLPVLSIKCLQNFAVCSTLLAEILAARGVVCAMVAIQHRDEEVDHVDINSWRSVILHYFSWEVACVVVVLRMLHQTPITVHSLREELGNLGQSNQHQDKSSTAVAASVTECGDDIQLQFHVPSARELVNDYIVPSNTSLFLGQRRYAGSGYGEDEKLEHHYCSMHHNATLSEGAEYVVCRCHQEQGSGQFLSSANVPLLADEYDPVGDEVLASGSIATAPTEQKLLEGTTRHNEGMC